MPLALGSTTWKLEVNWLRGVYIALFFCNAIFASLFRTFGEDTLATFGTFDECDQTKNASCRGNQLIFRASFSISSFFFLRALLSRFSCGQLHSRTAWVLIATELPVFLALLVGSFYISSSFFVDYVHFTRVASGGFILFQIFCIVSLAYEVRDFLLGQIEKAEQSVAPHDQSAGWCSDVASLWKGVFLGICVCSLIAVVAGVTYLYLRFGGCSAGVAFTTITVAVSVLLVATCVSTWLDVGLLPPCVVAAYLVFLCWGALVSNPNKSCENSAYATSLTKNTGSMLANAMVAAFAMTWTSWRTSSAATKLFASRVRQPVRSSTANQKGDTNRQFSGAVVVDVANPTAPTNPGMAPTTASTPGQGAAESPLASGKLIHEPWQFYCMMFVAGLYMAMVLTDWDSDNKASNGVSMWVKIVSQWITIFLFSWTLVAPKLFPDRDFSPSTD